jgi:hypothetical protein
MQRQCGGTVGLLTKGTQLRSSISEFTPSAPTTLQKHFGGTVWLLTKEMQMHRPQLLDLVLQMLFLLSKTLT